MNKTRVVLAGATGWAGAELSKAVAGSSDIQLVAAVSRNHAEKNLGDVLGLTNFDCPIFSNAREALKIESDVFFEYTRPEFAKENVFSALDAGCNVVIGTSGLNNEDFQAIDKRAINVQRGVLAVGNFALTVVLLQKFSEMAARFLEHWEIIDYARNTKHDAPSGTARELAHRLSLVRKPVTAVPLDDIIGDRISRGATICGTQIHSIRLPGHVIGVEVVFGMHDERLSLRQDSGSSSVPYVTGALLAIRAVSTFVGLRRGLDSVINFEHSPTK